jgi:hypothetical protein
LSKETLRSLDEISLQGAEGGGTTTNGTNVCSVCALCTSAADTCLANTDGVCCQ